MCSGDIHRPQTLRTLSDCSCWGTGQRFRDLRQCVQVGFRENKLGDRESVCRNKYPWGQYMYTTISQAMHRVKAPASWSCPDVPRWPHVHTHALWEACKFTFSSKNPSVFCFTCLQLSEFWKGPCVQQLDQHSVLLWSLYPEETIEISWSSTWGGWLQQQSFDEQEVWFQIQLSILLVLWL